ncbi:aminoglycoside phosphotransferase family protein [Streptomyces fragilis]|uniref:Aminoglycoside phosphotransferase family protein n=1 Tax=Streptomyces fragilis TaxID=67301 RepID=A0ABV2YK12_9ACTN|nr:aminoglycoside phosphotransferase family protein [Streptomyces fragilis]
MGGGRASVRVPRAARDRLTVRFGPGVAAWCDALPSLVEELSERWGLVPAESLGGGTSRVVRCLRRDSGATVWLKVTPDPTVAAEEAEALSLWSGTPSVVDLLERDLRVGALLLADVSPALPAPVPSPALPAADALPPPGAADAFPAPGAAGGPRLPKVAALLRALRDGVPVRPERSGLRPLADRIGLLLTLAGRRLAAADRRPPLDPQVLERAHAACLALCADGPVGLVHGDLHAGNVLAGADGRLVAIDPRPTWGDPDFDAVDWVMDGVSDLPALERRAERMASLVPGQSADRVLAWCRALAAFEVVPALCAGRDDPRTRFLRTLAGQVAREKAG